MPKLAQLQQDGGWINPAKVKAIHKAVNAACDSLDGLADGVIGAYEKCNSVFDVGTLRCANGTDTGDTCLPTSRSKPTASCIAPSVIRSR